MTDRIKLNAQALRALNIPKALAQDFLEIDALGLNPPAPTEELVQSTMTRCEQALRDFQPVTSEEESDLPPSFSWEASTPTGLAESIGLLNACIHARAARFVRQNPGEPAVVFVDNHELIDPERWETDATFKLLDQVYQMTAEVLRDNRGKPIERLIILKNDPDAYNENDLAAMRAAIEEPTTTNTYLVPAKDAGPLRTKSCTLVANEFLFEMKRDESSQRLVVEAPTGIGDAVRVHNVCRDAIHLKTKAIRVYDHGKLNEAFERALISNGKLRDLLRSISRSSDQNDVSGALSGAL
jgi:hypothetical protein